jgi:hypothetical protein
MSARFIDRDKRNIIITQHTHKSSLLHQQAHFFESRSHFSPNLTDHLLLPHTLLPIGQSSIPKQLRQHDPHEICLNPFFSSNFLQESLATHLNPDEVLGFAHLFAFWLESQVVADVQLLELLQQGRVLLDGDDVHHCVVDGFRQRQVSLVDDNLITVLGVIVGNGLTVPFQLLLLWEFQPACGLDVSVGDELQMVPADWSLLKR